MHSHMMPITMPAKKPAFPLSLSSGKAHNMVTAIAAMYSKLNPISAAIPFGLLLSIFSVIFHILLILDIYLISK